MLHVWFLSSFFLSSMGRNVYGQIAHGAKCLVRDEMFMGETFMGRNINTWGETSMGRTVNGAKSPDTDETDRR